MRHSPHTTNKEYILADNDTLVPDTDLQRYITYTHDSFMRVSGLSTDKLISHPDMLKQVFRRQVADLNVGRTGE